uniref:Ubiquitin-like domain-containing protein n=1 Tax=Physcomitrium patens TaxID=3218 RepID=A0A7I4D2V4_PHYPA|nr:uncharacterized protein LOC112295797 isoform X6 [Physcomitrium patens]|eukprot:XP_024403578.1 uncharacterized protein LOC112295797 isoform X6 [Physcomitrella patens]
MEVNHEGSSGSGIVPAGGTTLGETVEIKIKTLDSQSYTLRVEKNVAVPVLKEQLASVAGVPVENQRLICRGKVLKDDQLLSAYNVEDGHTLHLVARQPPPTSGVGTSTATNEGDQGETGLPSLGSRSGHVSHSLLMGTINFPDNGEGQLPDLNRIINAVISSIGLHSGAPLQGGTGNNSAAGVLSPGVLPTSGGVDAGAADRNGGGDQGTGVRELELQIDALYGMPSNATGTIGPSPVRVVQAPVVVPDALTTMSQYLDRLEQSFAAEESARISSAQDSGRTEARATTDVHPSREEPQRGASIAALGALVNRVNNLLRGQASSALSRLASRLENEPTMLNAAAREDVQHTAYHDGNLMQQIGALLLELGRATLSLRMGQSPSESAINSGPAIFISPTGPNPMMVQGSNVASFRQVFDLSRTNRHNFALPLQSAGGLAVGTGLPSTPAGGAGFTVRQLLERADHRNTSHAGATSNDAGGPARPNRPSNEAADGANPVSDSVPSGFTGMQGTLMTLDENGAVRVVPVRSLGVGHPPGTTAEHLGPRFQHQFIVRPASNPPNDASVAAAGNPVPPVSSDSSRLTDQASRSTPGDGGGASDLLNSLGPLLQHLAGALQQPGDTTLLQQQGRRRRQAQQSIQDEQRQAGQDVLQNLLAQREMANDMNQRLNTPLPSLSNLVRAVGGADRQQGDPGIIGQLMRSPVVENLVQQVMQGVGDVDGGDGARRGLATGDLDLSGMLQHMMPVVTQMLGGGSSAAFPGSVADSSARTSAVGARGTSSQPSETERWQDALSQEELAGWNETIVADEEAQQSMPPQRPLSDVYRRGTPAAKRQKTVVETAAEKLESGGSAEVVLRDLTDAANAEISGNNGTAGADDLAQQVVRVDGLAEAYLLVLFNDLAARVAADPDFGDGSRFPHAARIFRQPPQTPTEPDGE